MPIDYKAESLRLNSFEPGQSSDFWKPNPGQYKLRALSEIEEAPPFKKDGQDDQPQAQLKVLLDEKQFVWTFAVGKSPASTYGQLIDLANKYSNKLAGVDFMVVVVSDKNKKRYTIVKL